MNITASYKDSFIEAVINANKEIFTYINNKIELTDYQKQHGRRFRHTSGAGAQGREGL
jgi:hypothetical protein